MKVVREYREEALRFVWVCGEGVTSRGVWMHVNEVLRGEKTVHASILLESSET